MMHFLRTDGNFKIYIIKHRYLDKIKNGWGNSGDCRRFIYSGRYDKYINIFTPFSASGKCWQKTGIHGSYVKRDAIRILDKISEWNPEHRFKVCRLLLNQTTEDVVEKKYAK